MLVGIWCLKYQKLFKTLIMSRFQGMYWHAHKIATLTSIQHTSRNNLDATEKKAKNIKLHPIKQTNKLVPPDVQTFRGPCSGRE